MNLVFILTNLFLCAVSVSLIFYTKFHKIRYSILLLTAISLSANYRYNYNPDTSFLSEGVVLLNATIKSDIQVKESYHLFFADLKGHEELKTVPVFDYSQNQEVSYNDMIVLLGSIKMKNGSPIVTINKKANGLIRIAKSGFLDKQIDGFRKRLLLTDTTGILVALILGEQGRIKERYKEVLKDTGLLHLIVVSGFHLSVIFFFFNILLQFLFLRLSHLFFPFDSRKFSYLAAYGFSLLYFLIITPSTSSFRAIILISFFLLSRLTDLNSNPVNYFLFSIFFHLHIFPLDLFSVSFQMSYLLIFSYIVLYKSEFGNLLQKNKIYSYLAIAIYSQIIIIPLTSFYFNTFSPFSFIYNIILTLPFIAVIFPVALSGLLVELIYPSLYMPVYKILDYILTFGFNILNELTLKQLYFHLEPLEILLYYSVLLFLLFRKNKLFLYLTISLFILFVVDKGLNFLTEKPSARMHLIDVNHGDAILINFENFSLMVDTGGNKSKNSARKKLLPFLIENGARALDTLIITHADYDHYGNMEELYKTISIKKIILSEYSENNPEFGKVLKLFRDKGTLVEYVWAGMEIDIQKEGEKAVLKILSPEKGVEISQSNESSIVARLKFGEYSILLTGDATREILSRVEENYGTEPFINTIFKVPHHGRGKIFDERSQINVISGEKCTENNSFNTACCGNLTIDFFSTHLEIHSEYNDN